MLVFAHVGSGSYDPLILGSLLAAAGLYFLRVRSLSRQGKPAPAIKRLSFFSGVAVVVLGLVSPIAHLGEELFWVHMVQHLLIMDIGALLIVLGLTGPILQPILRIRALAMLQKLAHPAVILPLWALNLYLWHLPALYQAAITSESVHALEHISFISLGIGIWMPLFGPLPKPTWFGNGARLLYIVAVRGVGALLANILIWSGTVFYPDYAAGERLWNISALADQGTAGQIMMIEGSILTLVLFGWLFFKAARESEERQQLLEYAQSRGVDLDQARATRAAAAESGAKLRKRIAAGAGKG